MNASADAAPIDLSVMIPCKNNARTIARVLDSVKGLASQIVVVDSGSTDETMEIVRACRTWAEVVLIRTPWRGYVRTKQLALESCTRTHTLWLDSDEPVSLEMARSVRSLTARGVHAARVRRVVEYKGKLLEHAWQPEWRLRLIRTELVKEGHARFEGLDPHDHLGVDPGIEIETLGGVLIHDSFERFSDHFQNQLNLARVHAQTLHAHGATTSVWKIMGSPVGAFAKQIVVKQAWRDGPAGWLAASTSAAGTLMKHAALYELTQSTQAESD